MSKLACTLTVALLLAGESLAQTAPQAPPAQASSSDVQQTMQDVWRESIEAPQAASSPASTELQRVIERLRATKLQAARPAADPIAAGPKPAPVPTSQPTTQAAPVTLAAATQPATRPVFTPAEIERLHKLAATDATRAAELAGAMFEAGYLKEAYGFFELALKSQTNNDEKAWLLWQMAACKRDSDPAAARAIYQQLVREHGDSALAPAASAQDKLLEFYEVNKPQALVKGPESQPTSN
jgi:tetratricopeptide (TPR) repeat protein